MPNANGLQQLSWLHFTLSQLAEGMKAFKAAQARYLTAGDHENVAQCVNFLSEPTKTQAWYFLGDTRKYTFTASVDKLFVKSMKDRSWGLSFKIWHWGVKLYYGGDIVQVRTHLENLFLQCQQIGDLLGCRFALEGLADVAFCEGRLSDAMDILQKLVEMFDGQDPKMVLWYTVRTAVIESRQGAHDLAREFIHKVLAPFQFFVLRNARAFLHISYTSVCIELTAGEYDKAKSRFTTTIDSFDMQGNLVFKAFSLHGLGEVAFAQGAGDFALAAECFAETRSLPTEMGVPP
ncbi:hypothetical protein DFH29DRAFT_1037992 [Suillus ampliporus]|nr:hypothetical protein DFH29DRAFT_1037992 [Suillus ampliporus]